MENFDATFLLPMGLGLNFSKRETSENQIENLGNQDNHLETWLSEKLGNNARIS
jgi:hypothetical protein